MQGTKQRTYGFVMFVRARATRRERDGHQMTRKVSGIQTHGGRMGKMSCCWRKCSVEAIVRPGRGAVSKYCFEDVFTVRESLCLRCWRARL